jgi:hypothetical protein
MSRLAIRHLAGVVTGRLGEPALGPGGMLVEDGLVTAIGPQAGDEPADVPLCFKHEIWVRSHYDTITVAIADAPAPDEIVLIGAVASRGRLNARLGGKTVEEALADTGESL